MFVTKYKEILFIEGAPSFFEGKGVPVEADLSFRIGAQLKSLRDVKDELIAKAQEQAASFNAIVNFTYGQKSRFLAIDDVAFWGKGIAVRFTDEQFAQILAKSN